ncbi:hypothetical protein [Phocaeicola barnesiae]|uniref:hypothetical protein n=1 Tax=Phocaeicola barnesiae TaxID=376804 RepID=UPI00266EC399|nr:hypothetical protein [Phocaeicola barnesiae]
MNLKLIVLSFCVLASINLAKGQTDNRNQIRFSVSDGLTLSTVDILGTGISDAITGGKRSDQKGTLLYGLGYRYSLNRFKVGADLGFARSSSKLTLTGESSPSIKEKNLNFLVLPTAEFVYLRKGLFEMYGSASAGINLSRHTEDALTEAGRKNLSKSDLTTSFIYQVNPIGFSVGNDRIGGFVEVGLGSKGFLTAGLSLKF